jgi:hypothetical protein
MQSVSETLALHLWFQRRHLTFVLQSDFLKVKLSITVLEDPQVMDFEWQNIDIINNTV